MGTFTTVTDIIAGWVYESYWYGFFGISLAQISLQPYQVMVEGVPGILIIVSAFIIVIIYNSLFSAPRRARRALPINQLDNLPRVILQSYYLASVINFAVIGWFSEFINPVPPELMLSIVGTIIVTLITFALYVASNIRENILEASPTIFAVLANVISAILANYSLEQYAITITLVAIIFLEQIVRLALPRLTRSATFESFARSIEAVAERIRLLFRISWRVWIGLLFLFLLFLSVGLSALLGKVDAAYGRRLMLGGWRMQEVYLHSESTILPLPNSIRYSGYDYGPFGLVFVDDQSYYFVEVANEAYYKNRPALYIVPRFNDSNYTVLYSPRELLPTPIPSVTPQPTKTLTPLPPSNTPEP